MILRKIILVLFAVSLLSGCSKLKSLTGQKDNTVLPGAREEILPPDAQTARDPVITGEKPKECDPQNSDCIPPIDQESAEPQ